MRRKNNCSDWSRQVTMVMDRSIGTALVVPSTQLWCQMLLRFAATTPQKNDLASCMNKARQGSVPMAMSALALFPPSRLAALSSHIYSTLVRHTLAAVLLYRTPITTSSPPAPSGEFLPFESRYSRLDVSTACPQGRLPSAGCSSMAQGAGSTV